MRAALVARASAAAAAAGVTLEQEGTVVAGVTNHLSIHFPTEREKAGEPVMRWVRRLLQSVACLAAEQE